MPPRKTRRPKAAPKVACLVCGEIECRVCGEVVGTSCDACINRLTPEFGENKARELAARAHDLCLTDNPFAEQDEDGVGARAGSASVERRDSCRPTTRLPSRRSSRGPAPAAWS